MKKGTKKKAATKTATSKRTSAEKPKKKASAKRKASAKPAPRTRSAPLTRKRSAARPSATRRRSVAVDLPLERALTDEEREAMAKVAQTALSTLAGGGVPERIVARIAMFVEEIRRGVRPEPSSQDVRLGIGVLWGEQVRAQVGWRWVHLSYPNGFASYALVPDDRAFVCFPLNRLGDLMREGAAGANTAAPLFDSIRVGTLPSRQQNAYLVIG